MAELSTCLALTRESTLKVHDLIKDLIHRTPVLTGGALNEMPSTPRTVGGHGDGREPAKPIIRLWFKCENLQRVGAVKARGAFHAIERLKRDPSLIEGGGMKKGVVGFSAGNHAQALALAARETGIPAHIVMPDVTRPSKIAATKAYGANVIVCPRFEREATTARAVAEKGARLVPPFNHPDVILGQGTAGLELQEQVEHLDAIIAPCTSGGGLLAGRALPNINLLWLEGVDDCRRGFIAGERITSVSTSTIADGLIGVVGEIPRSVICERRLVDGMFAVTEEQILEATRLILERLKEVVEPAAAVTLAVALYNEEFRCMVEREAGEKGWDLGLILSGGNVSAEGLAKLFGLE